MKRLWLLFTALSITSALAQPAPTPLELAQRLGGPNIDLFVGELPPKERLKVNLPTPPKTHVVGATAQKEPDPANDFASVYLTSAQDAASLRSFYQKLFRPSVWKQSQGYQQPGFLAAGEAAPGDSLTFCRTKGKTSNDVYLTLTPHARETLIDVQVNTYDNTQGGSACDESGNDYELPLPVLTAPEKSTSSIVEYLSGFGRSGSSTIVLKTGLGAKGLLEHYAQQLGAKGWREQDSLVNGTQTVQTAVYRFRYKNAAYVGTLQVTPLAKGSYLAQLTVVKPL